PVRVLGGAERLPYAAGPGGRVRRVDEAGVDFAAGDVVERLPDVLGEHDPGLEPLPETEGPEAFCRVLAGGNGLGVADHDPGQAGREQVRGPAELETRVGGRDDRQNVSGEDPMGLAADQPPPREVVHLSVARRDEQIHRRPGLDLLPELPRRAEAVAERDPGMGPHEGAPDLFHGVLRADGGRDGDLLRPGGWGQARGGEQGREEEARDRGPRRTHASVSSPGRVRPDAPDAPRVAPAVGAAPGWRRWSSIIAPVQIWAIGLATPRPAMSGAEPCTGSNIDGYSRSGLMLPPGARPIEPAMAGPRSDRMSPNRLLATTTSN